MSKAAARQRLRSESFRVFRDVLTRDAAAVELWLQTHRAPNNKIFAGF